MNKWLSIVVLLGVAVITPSLAESQEVSSQEESQTETVAEGDLVDQIIATQAEFKGEVTVTARKREEVVMDVPASVQVISGTELEEMNVIELEDLQWITPGLVVPGGGRASVAIRGVSNNVAGVGADPSTAVHFDGVYIPRPGMVQTETFDLERVEVLKGPEGTLYGRNATAGVINYLTRGPSTSGGSGVSLDYGSYDLFRADVGINIPTGEKGGIRVSGRYTVDDGYTENIEPDGGDIDNLDYLSFRLKGTYKFTDTFRGSLTLQSIEDNGVVASSNNPETDNLSTLIGPQRTSPRDVSLDPVIRRNQDGLIGSLMLDASFGAVSFRSVTGYVDYEDDAINDNDGTGLWIERGYGTTTSEFFSQEFQLSGGVGTTMYWTAGLYYGHEDVTETAALVDSFYEPGDALFARFSSEATAETAAVFGELGILLSPKWRLTIGGRYTTDSKKGSAEGENLDFANFPDTIPYCGLVDISDSDFTPKAGLEYESSDNQLWYFTATNGFKSGGFNADAPVVEYQPESIWAYEFGSKTQLAGGKAALTVAAFYYDYTDIQLRTSFFPPSGGAFVRITNAASAEIFGAELGFGVDFDRHFSLNLGATYLSNTIDGYIPPGEEEELEIDMPLAPEWDTFVGLTYFNDDIPGALTVRAEYSYRTEVIFRPSKFPEFESEDPVGLVNLSINYAPRDSWYVALIGRNLTDETYKTNRFYYPGFSDLETYAPPRRIDLRLGVRF